MAERHFPEAAFASKPNKEKVEELEQGRGELMKAKQERLEGFKDDLEKVFGKREIPKELVGEILEVRREIADRVTAAQYLDSLELFIQEQIARLAVRVDSYKNPRPGETAAVSENGEVAVTTGEGGSRSLSDNERVLYDSMEMYFDSYRMAQNAVQFRRNVNEFQQEIFDENVNRKSNFYTEREKRDELVERLQDRYIEAGFTEDELKELVKTCDLKKLYSIGVEDIKVIAKIRGVFERFMSGDKAKYVVLSAALLVPAFIDGYAPMFLANAFKESKMDMTQVGMFALLQAASAGCSTFIDMQFKEFLNKNFTKEEGVGRHIAENVAEFPADQIGNFGVETVKRRIANAKESYEEVYKSLSFDIAPAVVTLITSLAMLYEKNPTLAIGTAAGTGFMMLFDKYMEKVTGRLGKKRKAEKQIENFSGQIQEQLNAHMEIILSGMKDELAARMEVLLAKERIASSDRQFTEIIRDRINQLYGSLNLVVAGLTTFLAGGSSDKFIAALVYSGNFYEGINKIMKSRRHLVDSFRDIMQMELMFNGYAAEEKEKEKGRVGVSEISSADVDLKNVEVVIDGNKILDVPELHIPQGSMVDLTGATGSGKTTLMKVIAGYYRPTAGEVQFGRTNIDTIKKSGEDSIYTTISYLPQFPYIMEASVRRNVMFGLNKDVPDARINEVLSEVGLAERLKNLNEPLKGGRGDTGVTSGGETARIGLARVLLKIRNSDSRVVFLDEPTASVDEKTAEEIAVIINREKRSRPDVTFIVISHDRNFIDKLNCDVQVRMDKGMVQQSSVEKNKE